MKYTFTSVAFLLFIASSAFAGSSRNQISFIQNKGQWHSDILYQSKLPNNGYVFLEQNGLMIAYHNGQHPEYDDKNRRVLAKPQTIDVHSVRIEFLGTSTSNIHGEKKLNTYNNYFIGNDASKWASHVPLFSVVRYQNIYNGIDLEIESGSSDARSGHFKYNLVVSPNSNANQIAIKYSGQDDLQVNQDGSILIKTTIQDIVEQKPYAYQVIRGKKVQVACVYDLDGNILKFKFPKGYDKNLTLIIDPEFIGATYSRANDRFWGEGATYDDENNIYLLADEAIFPVYTGSPGAYQVSNAGGTDMVIIKYDSTCANRIFGTLVGGVGTELPISAVIDGNNDIVIVGKTDSDNFPVTPTAYDTSFNGLEDLVVFKLTNDGTSLVASTYIGGSDRETEYWAYLLNDDANDYYITANTNSTNFPIENPIQPNNEGMYDGVIFKLSEDLGSLIWSTYLGGSGIDDPISFLFDANGDLIVLGQTRSTDLDCSTDAMFTSYQGGFTDGFMAKVKNDGSSLDYLSYYGGDAIDGLYFGDLDCDGNIYITGSSDDTTFPNVTTNYVQPRANCIIFKMGENLDTIIYSSTVGSSVTSSESLKPAAFHVDEFERIYIVGVLNMNTFGSGGFPTTPDAFQDSADNPISLGAIYLTVFEKDIDSLIYASLYVGDGQDFVNQGSHHFNEDGRLFMGMSSFSRDLAMTPGGAYCDTNYTYDRDAVALIFDLGQVIPPAVPPIITQADSCGESPITANNPSAGISNSFWNWGNGDSSIGNPVTYTYNDSGTFVIENIIRRACQFDTFTSTVMFVSCDTIPTDTSDTTASINPFIYIPNAFSPNNDGNHDVYRVLGAGIEHFELTIFDRKGRLVYQLNDINESWDGKYRNKLLGNSSFTYKAEVAFSSGKIEQLKGTIALVD